MKDEDKTWADNVKHLSFDEKLKRSLDVLKQTIEKKDKDIPLIVNFSGGKDSITCLLLAKMVTDNVVAFYIDGGLDLPDTLPFIEETCRKYGVELLVAKAGVDLVKHDIGSPIEDCHLFGDYVRHYGYFPQKGSRWCSIYLKQRVMKSFWKKRYGKGVVLYKISGVRMFESKTRLWKYGKEKHFQKYSVDGTPYFRYDNEFKPSVIVHPIVEWTDEDVLEFLKRQNVIIHEGYKKFGFSGCKWCPVRKKEDYIRVLKIDINMYDDIIQLEQDIGKPAGPNGEWIRDYKAEVEKEVICQ